MQLKGKRLLSFMLTFMLVATFCFSNIGAAEAEAESSLTTVKPAVVVTGDGIIQGGTYRDSNVSNERSYTLDELKTMANTDETAAVGNRYTYSTLNTYNSKKTYLVEGIRLDTLLGASNLSALNFDTMKISTVPSDSPVYAAKFDPARTTYGTENDKNNAQTTQKLTAKRYYYPNADTDSTEGAKEVPTVIAWAGSDNSGSAVPSSVSDYSYLMTATGQLGLGDYNNPLFSKYAYKVVAGDQLSEKVLTVGSKEFTRADLLFMDRADHSYTYSTSGGDKTEYVRGVPVSVLLADYEDDDVVSFAYASAYADTKTYTKKELVDANAVLGYENGTSASDRSEGHL